MKTTHLTGPISMASDVSADFVESAWDPIIPNLNAGDMCDAIISAMTKTDEREQAVDFTRAYYTSSQGVIGGWWRRFYQRRRRPERRRHHHRRTVGD